MPSSSTGTTCVEQALAAHFRRVFVHLSLSSQHTELEYLIDQFADTFDLTDTQLQRALYPNSLPSQEREKARDKIEALEHLRCESRALKWCNRIIEASNACGDMGWMLKQVGRTKEGEQWCEYDRLLTILACELVEAKKRELAKEADERDGKRVWVCDESGERVHEVIEID
jgi:hypothetical protein